MKRILALAKKLGFGPYRDGVQEGRVGGSGRKSQLIEDGVLG